MAHRAQYKWLFWALGFSAQLAACGDVAPADVAVEPAGLVSPLLRKPPSLASTIYEVNCQTDADCVLVPQGDVCQCAGWGAMRADNETKFLQRRARLGQRCAEGRAPSCPADTALQQARCIDRQCVALAPRALACVDRRLPNTWPLDIELSAVAPSATAASTLCPAGEMAPEGGSQTFLLQPRKAGRYRISLTATTAVKEPLHWLLVRTPDCEGDNVTCRLCRAGGERCVVDEALGPDDAAIITVYNCDEHCHLRAGAWDEQTPLAPPL